MTYKTILSDPTEWNGKEVEKCTLCHNTLSNDEIQINGDDPNPYCDNCFYSCCGDELDQDIRMCPTCKEHN